MLRLYVWQPDGGPVDYSDAVAVAVASSCEEARILIHAQFALGGAYDVEAATLWLRRAPTRIADLPAAVYFESTY